MTDAETYEKHAFKEMSDLLSGTRCAFVDGPHAGKTACIASVRVSLLYPGSIWIECKMQGERYMAEPYEIELLTS